IRQSNRIQAKPRPQRVTLVESGRRFPCPVPSVTHRCAGEAVHLATDQVSPGVAGKRVKGDQGNVGDQDDATEADSKVAIEVKGDDRVVPQNDHENYSYIKEITMDI